VPSPSLGRRGAKLPIFFVLFCCFCDTITNFRQKGNMLPLFFWFFLVLLGCHP
jgi:hypothetical protein